MDFKLTPQTLIYIKYHSLVTFLSLHHMDTDDHSASRELLAPDPPNHGKWRRDYTSSNAGSRYKLQIL
jgi:hypothetical protein